MQVVVRRSTTLLLLLTVTVTIVVLTVSLSGRSYTKVDPIPFEGIRNLWHRIGHRAVPTATVAVVLMPLIGNVLLFLPWGFLTFIALDAADRPALQTHLLTILSGLSFSIGVEAVQYFLPSRVADINDVIWNTAGVIAGAILGHARLRIRFEFQ